ncbi:MAG: RHS repeat-associated core domain-containing protein [Bacteroidota bacterium]
MNLPYKVDFGGGNTIEWLYDAAGIKLRKTVKENSVVRYTQDYVGGIEYRDSEVEAIYHAEGRATLKADQTFLYEYALKDHLGNSRVMFADANGDNSIVKDEILQESHYYPFGMTIDRLSETYTREKNDYLYNGKELNTDFGLGWMDYGARFYDAAVGRWNGVDPLAEDFLAWSPFVYGFNNPIKFIDPTGMAAEDPKESKFDHIHIRISAKPVGTAQIRLIGSENTKAPKVVDVSVYEMTVTDDVTGESSVYLVTRDGPVLRGANGDGTYEVINTTFEPATEGQKFSGIASEYPTGTGLLAITFSENGSRSLDAEPNKYASREHSDVAKGVSIHVGGEYTNANGGQSITGSLGCFTLCGKDAGNSVNVRFKKDIENRRAKNRRAGKGQAINITVEKREDKNVILRANVNSRGKATKYLETQK